ncbi:MAG: prephenate dehydratase [Elusimicrobia bacterium]|nr:prephenate dehydratase [Elusimicrobiota bacterium]
MTLRDLRDRIDRLDAQILRLLNARAQRVKAIGQMKTKQGHSIFVPQREQDVLARLIQRNHGPLPREAVAEIFREVVHACRDLQRHLHIAYFGPEATFTHMAARRQFGSRATLFPCRSIADVFDEVEAGRSDYGVVPIENSTEGVVNHTLDMFIEVDLKICAELELPVSHSLLSRAASLKTLRRLASHPQALAQCRGWLEATLPAVKIVEAASTAEAAKLAASDPRAGAIASTLAAELYGLRILAQRIEDSHNNLTRFLVIGRESPARSGRDKSSILFSIKDRVGALHDMLVPFQRHRINLTKIESRPSRRKPWEYVFFVDFLGHVAERRVQAALRELEPSCLSLKVLGSYPLS